MLFSPTSISDKTILDNANTLAHIWDISDPSKHRLHIDKAGVIKVVPFTSHNLTLHDAPRPNASMKLSSPLSETLAQEKMILLWHWSQFKPLVEKRSKEIARQPITNLQTCYEVAHTLQGLIQLCQAMTKRLSLLIEQINQHEKVQTVELDMLHKLAQVQFLHNLDQMQEDAFMLLSQLRAKQKLLTTTITPIIIFNDEGSLQGITATLNPKSFDLDVIKTNHPELTIKAKWEILNCWSDFTQQPLYPMVSMLFMLGNSLIPINCLAYPCFRPANGYQECTLSQVESGMYGVIDYCQQFVDAQGEGCIPYFQSPDLLMMLLGPYHIFNAEFLMQYTQLMIEMATLGNYDRVIFYAPYSFSYKAYELGFHSNDKEVPQLKTQQRVVTNNFQQRTENTIDETINRFTPETQKELLRPFYFELSKKEKRRVFFTKSGNLTTYADLIKQNRILTSETYPQGIFPQFHLVPKRPLFSFRDLMNRETIGKSPKSYVMSRQEKVDFHWLEDDKTLQQIGTASNEQESTKNEHKTLLKLKAYN
jgi:hypothetical protein